MDREIRDDRTDDDDDCLCAKCESPLLPDPVRHNYYYCPRCGHQEKL